MKKGVRSSFRPLAGITVFRTDTEHVLVSEESWFPSPGGDYGLSDWGLIKTFQELMGGFPSPGGDYGLSDCCVWCWAITSASSFRPLAGITVFRT